MGPRQRDPREERKERMAEMTGVYRNEKLGGKEVKPPGLGRFRIGSGVRSAGRCHRY